jgi:hypothetical protein
VRELLGLDRLGTPGLGDAVGVEDQRVARLERDLEVVAPWIRLDAEQRARHREDLDAPIRAHDERRRMPPVAATTGRAVADRFYRKEVGRAEQPRELVERAGPVHPGQVIPPRRNWIWSI